MPKGKNVVILGLDPGIGRTGWGVIQTINGKKRSIEFGCIETEKNTPSIQRITTLFHQLTRVLSLLKPDIAGVETLLFNTNTTTAMRVGEARGVILLALSLQSIPIREYTPLQVKQAVGGYGRASKEQIQRMVKQLLSLQQIPKPDDAADALAVALTVEAGERWNSSIGDILAA